MADHTEFKKSYIKKVDEYLKEATDEEYVFKKASGRVNGFEEKIKVKLPTVEGFALYLKVARSSVYKWMDEQPKFKVAVDKITKEQKKRLIDKGLGGQYNPIMAKFLLSANHGLREKSDVTSDDEQIGVFSNEQVNRLAERITSRNGAAGNTSSSK